MAGDIVAVHGATGLQGCYMARRLLDDGFDVRLVMRDPQRAVGLPEECERVRAELTDSNALADAYQGVKAVALQFPLIFDDAVGESMTTAVLRALAAARVGHVVVNTGIILPPEPVGIPGMDFKVRAVERLLASPVMTTVVQPGIYMENLAEPWSAQAVLAEGVIKYMVPDEIPLPWVALADVTAVASKAIKLGADAEGVFPVIGPQLLTGVDVADIVSRELGRPVRWDYMPPAQFADLVRPYLGDHAADGLATGYERMAEMDRPPAPNYERTADTFSLAQTGLRRWTSQSLGDDESRREPRFRRLKYRGADGGGEGRGG